MNETLAVNDIYQDGSEDEDESVPTMFKQKDLIKQAFAGDDVVSEFENEKKRHRRRRRQRRGFDITWMG